MSTNGYGITQDHLNGHSAAILTVFILVSFFVIHPVHIPVLSLVQKHLISLLYGLRIIDEQTAERLRARKLRFPLSLETAPVIGVLGLLCSRTIDGSTIILGVKGDENVKPYDVLVLFISLAYIAIALDGTGVLEAVAFWVSKRGGSSGPRLFAYLYAFFLFTGCIVGNDPLILSGTPFLAYLTKYTNLEPTAWIFSEFMAANTASAVLVSSNPTNILIAGSFSLNYLTDFTKYTILPSIIPGILNYFVLFFMFRHQIPKTITPLKDDPWTKLRDAKGAVFLSSLMLVTIVVLVGTSFVPGHVVEVWMITMPAGLLAMGFEIVSDWIRPNESVDVVKMEEKDPAAEQVSSVDQKGQNLDIDIDDDTLIERGDRKVDIANSIELTYRQPSNPSANPSPSTHDSSNIRNKSYEPEPHKSQNQTQTQTSNYHKHTLQSLLHALSTAHPRTTRTLRLLPLPLLPFAISQFILVRSLSQRGWITVFARGFSNATPTPTTSIFFFGFISACFLCPFAGTNIGATILLVEIMRHPIFLSHSTSTGSLSSVDPSGDRILRGAIYATAMGSNLGAFSYVFAASLAGLLWRGLLEDKGIVVGRGRFFLVNLGPLVMQCLVAFALVLGEVYWFG